MSRPESLRRIILSSDFPLEEEKQESVQNEYREEALNDDYDEINVR